MFHVKLVKRHYVFEKARCRKPLVNTAYLFPLQNLHQRKFWQLIANYADVICDRGNASEALVKVLLAKFFERVACGDEFHVKQFLNTL